MNDFNDFEWMYLPSGLGVRRDEFSVQGCFQGDARFYLRRDRRDLGVFTDLLFGSLDDSQVSDLFAEFLENSGGVNQRSITILDVARLGDEKREVVARYDRIVAVLKSAVASMGFEVDTAQLNQVRSRFDAMVKFSDRTSNG